MSDKGMKIGELLALLQDCDPAGTVYVTLDAALVDGGNEAPDGVEYDFREVEVRRLSTGTEASKRENLHICICNETTERCIKTRSIIPDPSSAELDDKAADQVAMDAPVAVAIALSHETYKNLMTVVDNCNRCHDQQNGLSSHGRLTVSSLLSMLAQDAAMTNSRPGSWEGSNMQQVLDSHGYQ
jgi:hypothetical protein